MTHISLQILVLVLYNTDHSSWIKD